MQYSGSVMGGLSCSDLQDLDGHRRVLPIRYNSACKDFSAQGLCNVARNRGEQYQKDRPEVGAEDYEIPVHTFYGRQTWGCYGNVGTSAYCLSIKHWQSVSSLA